MRYRGIIIAALLAAVPAAAATPQAAIALVQTAPYRYGGDLSGQHLSLGLQAPLPDNSVTGEAILFTPDRRLVATASVVGRIARDGTCHLSFDLPEGTTMLDGTCRNSTVQGELRSTPPASGWLHGLVVWWGGRTVPGRAWLTQASFDPQS